MQCGCTAHTLRFDRKRASILKKKEWNNIESTWIRQNFRLCIILQKNIKELLRNLQTRLQKCMFCYPVYAQKEWVRFTLFFISDNKSSPSSAKHILANLSKYFFENSIPWNVSQLFWKGFRTDLDSALILVIQMGRCLAAAGIYPEDTRDENGSDRCAAVRFSLQFLVPFAVFFWRTCSYISATPTKNYIRKVGAYQQRGFSKISGFKYKSPVFVLERSGLNHSLIFHIQSVQTFFPMLKSFSEILYFEVVNWSYSPCFLFHLLCFDGMFIFSAIFKVKYRGSEEKST